MRFRGFLFALVMMGAGFASAEVLWRHAADDLQGVHAGPYVHLAVEDAAHLVSEGTGSIRATFARKEALGAPASWNGFFNVRWALPGVELREGDRLQLHYRMNVIESFYPSVSLRLIDDEDRVWSYQWNKGEGRTKIETSGHWLEVDIDLFAEHRGGPERLGRIVALEVVANNRAFQAVMDYIRWFDDVRIVRTANQSPDLSAEKSGTITVRQTTDRFPVYFAPYRPGAKAGGEASGRADTPPVRVEEARFIPHSQYNSWSGPQDHSALFWMEWNEEGLLFITQVTDDILRFDHVHEVDFKDADHVRLYFDLGRESQRLGEIYDANDYVFAAVPDSPDGIPLMRQVNWGFFNTAPLVEPVESFPLLGRTQDTGWELELFFPAKAFPDWHPRPNQALVFGACWGDTDSTIRDNELFWPDVRGPDSYWRDYRLYADVVLMDSEGGFTLRVMRPKVFVGQPWEILLAARLAEAARDPQRYRLRIQAMDAEGRVAQEWESALPLQTDTAFHRIEILADGLPAGAYTLRAELISGQVVLRGDDWPIELMEGNLEQSRAAFHQRLGDLRTHRDTLREEIKERAQAGLPVDYDRVNRAILDLFLPQVDAAIRAGNYLEGDRLLTALERVRAEAETDPRLAEVPAAMRPSGEPVELRNGALYHQGQRILMVGFTSDYNWHPELVSALGFNAFHSNHPLRNSMPEPFSSVPPEDAQEWRDRYKRLQEYGIFGAVVGLTAGTPTPKWLAEHPAISRSGGHFIPYAIEEPKSIEMLEIRYREALKIMADIDNIVVYLLLNEPTYEGRTPEFDSMFRAWLKNKYTDIATLNEAWDSAYASFDDVPTDKLSPAPRARYDWAVCNQELLTDHVRLLQDYVHRFDPKRRPTHVKVTSQQFRFPGAWSTGVDRERISMITDAVGYDSPQTDEPMKTDYMRSLAPGKPLVNSEVHMPWFTENAPWMQHWRMAARGVDVFLSWEWQSPGHLKSRTGYPTQLPYGTWRTGREALDMQRVADPLHALAQAPQEIAILHTLAALTFEPQNLFRRTREVYDALQYVGAPIRFVTDQQLARGELTGDVKLVVAAGITHMEPDHRAALDRWTKDGGLLLTVDSPLNRDVGAEPLTDEWSAPDRVVAIDVEAAEWQDRVKRFQRMSRYVEQAGVHRPLRIEDPHGEPRYGIEYWTSADGRWLFVAPMELDEGSAASVRFAGEGVPERDGFDLIRQKPFSFEGVVNVNRHQAYVIELPRTSQ